MMIHQGSWWDIKSVRREGREKGEPPDGGGQDWAREATIRAIIKYICVVVTFYGTLYI